MLAAAKATRPDAFAFQRTTTIDRTGSARRVIVQRFDPRRAPADRWSLVSVDGHAPTDKDLERSRKAERRPVPSYADLAEWLLAQGIESMSLNPDTVVDTWLRLAKQSAPAATPAKEPQPA